jgi:hypothetical protein
MAVSPGQCQPAAAQDNHRAARDNRARVRRVVNWHDFTKAIEAAKMPAAIATPASATIQAMLAYSSQNPRRRSRDTSEITKHNDAGH